MLQNRNFFKSHLLSVCVGGGGTKFNFFYQVVLSPTSTDEDFEGSLCFYTPTRGRGKFFLLHSVFLRKNSVIPKTEFLERNLFTQKRNLERNFFTQKRNFPQQKNGICFPKNGICFNKNEIFIYTKLDLMAVACLLPAAGGGWAWAVGGWVPLLPVATRPWGWCAPRASPGRLPAVGRAVPCGSLSLLRLSPCGARRPSTRARG